MATLQHQDLERAKGILDALPIMSHTIVDDTLYEKVVLFISSLLEQVPTMAVTMKEWGFLSRVNEACEQPHQDYRVYAVCYRLLGRWITFQPSLFSVVAHEQPLLLERIATGLSSTEAALRLACFEACRGFVHSLQGAEWLLENEKTQSLMSMALLDESTYVVAESFAFYQYVLESKDQTHTLSSEHRQVMTQLAQLMDPSSSMKELLHPPVDPSILLPILEFCYVMANARHSVCLEYLENSCLLHSLLSLLEDDHRIVRTRMIEILTVVFEWAPDPLFLLQPNLEAAEGEEAIIRAYEFMAKTAIHKIQHPETMEAIVAGVSLLPCCSVLLNRLDSPLSHTMVLEQSVLLGEVFSIIIKLCVDSPLGENHGYEKTLHVLTTAKRGSFRKTLFHIAFRGLYQLMTLFSQPMTLSMESVSLLLNDRAWALDQSVLKSSVDLFLSLLPTRDTALPSASTEDVSKILQRLIQILDQDSVNCRCVSRILEVFYTILDTPKLETPVMTEAISAGFVAVLRLKCMDVDWDVRDTVVEFIGRLFQGTHSETSTFAITYQLPMLLLDRIRDTEAYVRSTTLTALKSLFQNKQGWSFIQAHYKTRDVARQLPRLLYDDEAFVRRAALDVLTCLIEHRSCQGILVSDTLNDKDTLNPFIVSRCMDDPDSEVRVRGCRFLESLWRLHVHELDQQKRLKTEDVRGDSIGNYFYRLKGDVGLLDAPNDAQRIVRAEALITIRRILNAEPVSTASGKRLLEAEDSVFLEGLASIDLDKLEQMSTPEHLYEETFAIDAAMMTHSLEPIHSGEDSNRLDCY
ncbi:armadillo-type protein [Spinellus fusiger]|nr:armadillo-type protein [Spinellus fusiger]